MKCKLSLIPLLFVFFAFIPSIAQTSQEEMQLGVSAYKESHYEEAARHFTRAAELEPTNVNAQMYLATTYVSQYIPGVQSDENKSLGDRAIAAYQKVLEMDANAGQKVNSCKGIAYIYLIMKQWDDAAKHYQMASDLDPSDPEPYYSIGVIDWTRSYQPRMEARARLGMQPNENLDANKPNQKKICDELQAKNSTIIEDGISRFERAIQLRPEYDDAMAYLNLMYRERADLECEDLAERQRDLKSADEWVDKALGTKKAKAEKARVAQ